MLHEKKGKKNKEKSFGRAKAHKSIEKGSPDRGVISGNGKAKETIRDNKKKECEASKKVHLFQLATGGKRRWSRRADVKRAEDKGGGNGLYPKPDLGKELPKLGSNWSASPQTKRGRGGNDRNATWEKNGEFSNEHVPQTKKKGLVLKKPAEKPM